MGASGMSRDGGLSVGMVLFPDLTQLDLTGPYEVFARTPGAEVHLLAPSPEPVRSEWGLAIVPDSTFEDAPGLGAAGVKALLDRRERLR